MKAKLTLLVSALGFAAAAVAQQDSAPIPEAAPPAPEAAAPAPAPEAATPKFADVDTNEDGKIDQEEAVVLAAAFRRAQKEFKFEIADANADGAIDASEYAALMS